jgi:hypothetical protein
MTPCSKEKRTSIEIRLNLFYKEWHCNFFQIKILYAIEIVWILVENIYGNPIFILIAIFILAKLWI